MPLTNTGTAFRDDSGEVWLSRQGQGAAADQPTAADLSGLPDTSFGLPMHYGWKELVHTGNFKHPTKKFRVDVDGRRLDHWVETFSRMDANGVKVFVPDDHKRGAADNNGWLYRVRRAGDRLLGLIGVAGDDAQRKVAVNDISVGIRSALHDGEGNVYPDAIEHVALTPEPVVGGQQPVVLGMSRTDVTEDEGDADLSAPGATHKYSSTQVQLPPDLAEAHRAYADDIDDDDLADDGREVDPHITCRYGLTDNDPSVAHAALHDGERKPAKVRLGKLAVFPATADRPSDVLHAEVESHDLHDLNGRLKAVDHVDAHPKYTPHCTLAYLKPGSGAKYAGKSVPGLTGKAFDAPAVRHSGADGAAVDLSLTTDDQMPVEPNPGAADLSKGGDDDEHWITARGHHILIGGDGNVKEGPSGMVGQHKSKLSSGLFGPDKLWVKKGGAKSYYDHEHAEATKKIAGWEKDAKAKPLMSPADKTASAAAKPSAPASKPSAHALGTKEYAAEKGDAARKATAAAADGTGTHGDAQKQHKFAAQGYRAVKGGSAEDAKLADAHANASNAHGNAKASSGANRAEHAKQAGQWSDLTKGKNLSLADAPMPPVPTAAPDSPEDEAASAIPPDATSTSSPTDPTMINMPMSDAVHARLHELTPGLDKVGPGDKAACISQHLHNQADTIKNLSMDDDASPDDMATMSLGGTEAVERAKQLAEARKSKVAELSRKATDGEAAVVKLTAAEQRAADAIARAERAEAEVANLSKAARKNTDDEVIEARAALGESKLDALLSRGAISPATLKKAKAKLIGERGKRSVTNLSRTSEDGPTMLEEFVDLIDGNVMVPGGESTAEQHNLHRVGDPRKAPEPEAAEPEAGDVMANAVRTKR